MVTDEKTYVEIIAALAGNRVVMVPLLAVNHELELGELFSNGQHFLIVNLLAATEASIGLLLLLVEGILAEV